MFLLCSVTVLGRREFPVSRRVFFISLHVFMSLTCVFGVCVCDRAGALKTYVSAAMALQYSQLPDYAALRGGLAEVLLQQGGSLGQPLSTCTS